MKPEMKRFTQAPSAVVPYTSDWSSELAKVGGTIVGPAEWTVTLLEGVGGLAVVGTPGTSLTYSSAYLGGTPVLGDRYRVTCHVSSTVSPYENEKSFEVVIAYT